MTTPNTPATTAATATDPTTTEEHDMTDHTATDPTTTDVDTTTGTDALATADNDHDIDPRIKSARADAAKYRTRLRDTEHQLTETTQRYEKLLRQVISATAEQHHGIPAAALWDSGASTADLLNEGGEIDLDKLTEACTSARERYGIPAPINGPIVQSVGTTPSPYDNPTWSDVLKDIGYV